MVDSKNYVFNPDKIEDMKNILRNAAESLQSLPKGEVTNPVAQKLIKKTERERS